MALGDLDTTGSLDKLTELTRSRRDIIAAGAAGIEFRQVKERKESAIAREGCATQRSATQRNGQRTSVVVRSLSRQGKREGLWKQPELEDIRLWVRP